MEPRFAVSSGQPPTFPEEGEPRSAPTLERQRRGETGKPPFRGVCLCRPFLRRDNVANSHVLAPLALYEMVTRLIPTSTWRASPFHRRGD